MEKTTGKSRLSQWFVNNQKVDGWDEKALNNLHTETIVLLFVAYVCHIVSSPYIELLNSTTIITTFSVIEVLCLILGIACFVKACYVNSSWTAAKLMFSKRCTRTYIFGFWLLRCFIIEILKGQVIYSFLIVFHSIMIYGSDTWYICNRKVLLLNMFMYLSMICYEFFVSISPVAPSKPVWTFLNVKVTANSLSRSNYFNLFVIFFDGLIVTLFDRDRSKYMMLVKKRKREVVQPFDFAHL